MSRTEWLFRAALPNEVQQLGFAFEKGKFEELTTSSECDVYGGASLIEWDKYYIVCSGVVPTEYPDQTEWYTVYVVNPALANSEDVFVVFRAWLRQQGNPNDS